MFSISDAATIKPANVSDEELMERVKNDPADEVRVSFWELPLWIKMHHIATLAVSALAIWKLLPLFAGKIKVRLENRNRKRILEFLSRNPGVSLRDLENHLKMNRSTLRHHIEVLESEGLIITIKAGKERLAFPLEYFIFNGRDIDRKIILRSDARKKILDVLSRNGGMRIGELAKALEMSYKTLHYHVAVLQKAGLVEFDGQSVKAKF
ncbi:ArsR family transcriptional regulator [Geoglobus acetivorans]|uniref:Helix-turn-helix domain-containing protein n=1 Tax=Geoglobus acetivorans TaxID=565033 RepID=A0ABZ3H6G4_GEOAI|nr:helix-turn-helix domain-containing protein [Geoglobus acetivorans]